jgi:membrane protein YqaA with SNARE-associated domain
MKTKNKVFWIILIIVLAVVITIITLNYDKINLFIEQNIGFYGYPAIFLFCFLADIIDQPIIPEVPSILGVVYGLDVFFVFLFAVAGIWIMSIINFNVGRRVFRYKMENLCSIRKYNNYCKIFHKYGKLSLLLAGLTPLPYVTFVWLSGAFGMKFRTFFVFGMVAKALRLGFFLFIFTLFIA